MVLVSVTYAATHPSTAFASAAAAAPVTTAKSYYKTPTKPTKTSQSHGHHQQQHQGYGGGYGGGSQSGYGHHHQYPHQQQQQYGQGSLTRQSSKYKDPCVAAPSCLVAFGFGGNVVTMFPKRKLRLNSAAANLRSPRATPV